MSVCTSMRLRLSVHKSKNQFQFLQPYQKMSLIKETWYILRAKNMLAAKNHSYVLTPLNWSTK